MDKELFDQFCSLEHWSHQPTQSCSDNASPQLNLWTQWQLRRAIPASSEEELPLNAMQIWQAWQHYHQGCYPSAHTLFAAGWAKLETEVADARCCAMAIDCALGLARLYTRSGHWHSARSFVVWALQQSRENQRNFDVSRSYNVLGDLLCRAGELQWAQVCLTTSTQMLPAGSVHKARHLNSLATVLCRQQQYDRAETLLMSSLYQARDTNDADSFWHALARLQFLYNAIGNKQYVREVFTPLLPSKTTPVAQAYLLLAETLHPTTLNANKTTMLSQALSMLTAFPMESAWLRHIQGLPQADELHDILNWQVATINSARLAIIDAVFMPRPLSEHSMQWLLTAASPAIAAQVLEQKQCFFI